MTPRWVRGVEYGVYTDGETELLVVTSAAGRDSRPASEDLSHLRRGGGHL